MTRRIALLVLAALVWTGQPALAQEPGIRVTPVVSDDGVAVSFVAPGAYSADSQAVVSSGLLLTFRFTVDVRRPTVFWWDQTVASVVAGSSVKFDSLTGVYHVSKLVDEHVIWSDRTLELAQARAWMTTFDSVPVAARGALAPDVEYYVRVSLRASPRRSFSWWPWSHDGSSGRADFTNVR